MCSCVLATQSVNSYEWITVLPQDCAKKAKELHIRRLLSSPLIDVSEVMPYYAPEVAKKTVKEQWDRSALVGSESNSRWSAMFDVFALYRTRFNLTEPYIYSFDLSYNTKFHLWVSKIRNCFCVCQLIKFINGYVFTLPKSLHRSLTVTMLFGMWTFVVVVAQPSKDAPSCSPIASLFDFCFSSSFNWASVRIILPLFFFQCL
jgi:hypothetical protein